MVRIKGVAAILLAAGLAACSTAEAQRTQRPSDEALRGHAYAAQVCAQCHAVEPGARVSPNSHAPPFQELANTPGMTATALNAWLHTSHPTMPNFVVEPDHVDDVAAYLASLKR
ncbi:MAG TPA: hypothetical protein VG943_02370 [Caulobacterales bacterium]|nr:hypothetical protein [Caulobacterales bacterium]